MKYSILIVSMLLCVGVTMAQPLLEPSDIPFGKIAGMQTFEGKALYGYIDGGAELYHEYGFIRLTVFAIEIQKEQFSVETYEMKNPVAAFGIFSVNHSRCASVDSIFLYSCIDPYQIQGVQGTHYFRIINEIGSKHALQTGLRIADVLHHKIPPYSVQLPGIFETSVLKPYVNNVRRMSGLLGVQNGAPDLEESLDGAGNFELWVLPIEDDSVQSTIVDALFAKREPAQRFGQYYGLKNGESFSSSRRGGEKIFVWQKSPVHIIVLKSLTAPSESIVQLLHAYHVP